MEEIIKLIPLLLIALLADTSIILFILVPPILFGGTFALIEWASQAFNPLAFIDIFQIGMYTGTTALISQFVPLFLTGVTLVWLRHYARPSARQFALLGLFFGTVYGLIHHYMSGEQTMDVMGFVALMSGIGAYGIDRFQQRRGTAPARPQQLFLAPDTAADLRQVSIQTDRLDLQSIDLSLSDIIFESFTPEVTRFLSTRAPMIPAESEQFLREALARITHGEEIVLAIRQAYTGRFLGVCGIHARHDASQPELGIWLREDAQGHGYGQEAIHALIAWGSRHLVCDAFRYRVSPHNHRSIRIAEAEGGTITQHPHPATETITTLNYRIPRQIPVTDHHPARLQLWLDQDDRESQMRSEKYRLTRERDILLASEPSKNLYAYTMHGRYLSILDHRLEQNPTSWIAAGEQIDRLIQDQNIQMPFFNKEAAIALAIYRISTRSPKLLSIEIISALTLDPPEPTITNRHDPIASVATIATIPSNYYVLIFAINGRHKYLYHFHSDGTQVFEEVHTMGGGMSGNALKQTVHNEQSSVALPTPISQPESEAVSE